MLSFVVLVVVIGLAARLDYVDCDRITICHVDGQHNITCPHGCLYLYTTDNQWEQKCYAHSRVSKTMGEDYYCQRDVSYDNGTVYDMGCRCYDSHCNEKSLMLLVASCRSVFPIGPDHEYYDNIDSCDCARHNPIACSDKQGMLDAKCSQSDATCPDNVPNYNNHGLNARNTTQPREFQTENPREFQTENPREFQTENPRAFQTENPREFQTENPREIHTENESRKLHINVTLSLFFP